MQSIETRYVGPTDRRGSRIIASAPGGRVVVSWDYSLPNELESNHAAAASALCAKQGWTGRMVGGWLPRDRMAWVFVAESPEFERQS